MSKMLNKRTKIKWIQRVITMFVLLMLIYIIWYQSDSHFSDKKNQELIQMHEKQVSKRQNETKISKDVTGEKNEILEEYRALYDINHDMIGWILIEDTKLSLPVVKGNDNAFYLKHDFYKQQDRRGSIFADCETDFSQKQSNILLYGHHMRDNSMFGLLEEYIDKDFYDKHKYIVFDSLYEKRVYEVMAVFRSKIYYEDEPGFKYYDFKRINSEEDFYVYCKSIATESLYETGVKAVYGEELLTLSTCDYSKEDGRLVVVAKKIDKK